MEYTFCKIQYVVKAEKFFNIRLNNHRKYDNGNNPNTISASIHFKQTVNNFKKHAKFTLTEQINKTINTDIDKIKIKLERKEDFRILEIDTLTPKQLNKELNNDDKTFSIPSSD